MRIVLAGMEVLFGIVLVIVGTVLAFQGHMLLMIVCVLIAAYPFSRAITNSIRGGLSRTERGRRMLADADRIRWMKAHGISRKTNRRGSRLNLVGDALYARGDSNSMPAALNATCPVCDSPVSDDESVCNSCNQHVHNACSSVCYTCDNVYCNNCLARSDYRCLHCGSHMGGSYVVDQDNEFEHY